MGHPRHYVFNLSVYLCVCMVVCAWAEAFSNCLAIQFLVFPGKIMALAWALLSYAHEEILVVKLLSILDRVACIVA